MAQSTGTALPAVNGLQFLTRLDHHAGSDAASHDIFIARMHHSGGVLASSSSAIDGGASSRDGTGSANGIGADDRFVVVRVYPLDRLRDDHRLRLQTERNQLVLRQAKHPHIIGAWPAFVSGTDLFTMEAFCEFGELFEVVEKSNEDVQCRDAMLQANTTAPNEPSRLSPDGLPAAVVLRLFDELLDAVAYCHDVLRICHRDIKLENVLLDANMRVQLCNFGMAAALGDDGQATSSTSNDFDRSHGRHKLRVACGSRHYAAPEILFGDPYDGRAVDVWCLGVVLFALVTGGFPVDPALQEAEASEEQGVGSGSGGGALDMDRLLPRLPSYQRIQHGAVQDLVAGMLQPLASRRWTLTAVQQQWKRIRRQFAAASPQPLQQAPSPSSTRR